ncbi:phage late control D family protein [Cupriavidus pauculus]|uniref:phage late control D family protein n=1 Tax=Cupriavidus pauculus TaxID=82633 RepID=UPI001D0C431B|nr:phage late control D family protein [Cupriavidus pauculus]
MDLSTVSDAVMGGAAVPVYRLMQGNKDITGRFQGRLISLTLTDNRGFEADQLDIELDDADGALSLPDKGATLSLGIGWQDTGVVDKGRYKVDELEHSGPPDRLTIRARSVDLAGGMTLRKERSFRGQTIGAIVGAIASKNALAAIVASALAGLVIDHIDQTSESDANFLTRLAKDHDAIATVKQGKLLFIKTGAAQSASGIALPTVEITRASGDTHSFLIADRENYNGVKAYYQDARRAVKGEVVIDASNAVKVVTKPSPKKRKKKGAKKTVADVMVNPNPDNVKVLRHTYASKSNAERAARAEWQRIQRGVASFRITLARGRPDLFPELPAIVRGWKSEIDNTGWIITKVTHNLSDHGYTSTLELEIKPSELGDDNAAS